MSFTDTPDPVLERGRLFVVIATIVINVVAVSLLTFAPWSDWRTGVALYLLDNLLLVGFTLAINGTHTACMLVHESHRFIVACSDRNRSCAWPDGSDCCRFA